MTNWDILNIAPTDSREAIKRAYMAQVPKYNPEDDPEGFIRLRTAYEQILKELENPNKSIEEEMTPIGLFLQRLEKLYNDFDRRRNVDEWKELLKDEACMRLDMEDETSVQILGFLMNHYYLPRAVWVLLDDHFGWHNRSMPQDFPANFIDFVISSTKYESLRYDLFSTDALDEPNYDRWIWLFYEMEALLFAPDDPDFLEKKREIESIPVKHIYYDMQLARIHIVKGNPEAALAVSTPIFEALPEDIRIRYTHATVLLAIKRADEALKHFEAILEKSPEDFGAKKGQVEALIELGEFEHARGILLEILDKYPYNQFALHTFRQVTEKLIDVFEEQYKALPDDMEIMLTLAKHYLNNYDYEKCREILEKQDCRRRNPPARYYEYLADCYAASGDFDQAVTLFEKNIAREKLYRNYVKFVSVLIDAEKFDQALVRLEEALLLEDEDRLSLAYLYDSKGLILHQKEKYNEALAVFDKGLAINSQAAHIYIHKARTYQHMHRFSEAIDYAEQAIAIFPYTTEAYTLQMEIFYDADLFDRMIALSDESDQVGFDSPRIKYHKACALRMQGNIEEAREILNALLLAKFDEGYKDFFHAEMAYLLASEGNFDAAVMHIGRAIDINAEYIYRYVFLGNTYRMMEAYDQALQVYGTMLEKNPGYVHALMGRGDVYFDQGDYPRARDDYKTAVSINEHNERAIDRIVDAFVAEDKYAEAIDWAERAQTLFDNINNRLRLAWLYSKAKRYEAAEALLEAVEQTGDVVIRRGLIFHKMGRHKESLALLLKLPELEEKEKLANSWNMSYLYTIVGIKFATFFNDAPNALKYYKIALERDRNCASAIKNMGDLYLYYYRDYAAALQLYEQKIELNPDDPHGYFARAQAYKHMKRYIRAYRDFKKALAMFQAGKGMAGDVEYLYYQVQMALCYVGLRKYNLARKMFNTILEDKGQWDECFYGLGLIYERDRKYEEALKYYDIAIEIADAVQYNAARDLLMKK